MFDLHCEKLKRVHTAFGSINLQWRLLGDSDALELGPDSGSPITAVTLNCEQAAKIRTLSGVTSSMCLVVNVAQMFGESLRLDMVGRKIGDTFWGGSATPGTEGEATAPALLKALSYAEQVISEVNCLVAILDRRGRIQRFNRVAEEVTGRREIDVIGVNAFDVFMSDEEADASRKNVDAFFRTGNAYEVERTILTLKGPRLYQFRNKFVHFGGDRAQDVLVCSGVDITDERRTQERLANLAKTDTLTGLGNRNYLTHLLSEHMASESSVGRLALLFIDLDNFKRINDSLGHQSGDQLLMKVAHRLQQVVCGNHDVMRISGDEFVVAVIGAEALKSAMLVASQIIAELNFSFVLHTNSYRIRASIGITEHTRHGDTEFDLLTRADLAMYEAKSVGKNKDASSFCLFNDELSIRAERALQIHQALQYGFLRDEFNVVYRPIRTMDGEICGVGASVSWNRPGFGMVPGDEFLPMAESAGFGIQIGQFVISESFKQIGLRDACASEVDDHFVMVGIPEAVLLDGDLLGMVEQSVSDHALHPAKVCLVLPPMFNQDNRAAGEATDRIAALRAMGVRVFVDISEQSSFPNIAALPIDGVVIDGAFSARLPTDKTACAIFRGLLGLCRDMSLTAVVNGVVAKEQYQWLSEFPEIVIDGSVAIPIGTAATREWR